MPDPVVVVPDPAAPPAPAAPWFKGLPGVDADFEAFATSKGWHTKAPQDVALEAVRSYRQAQQMIGVPPEEMVRLPKDPASPDWANVHQRLGRPAKPDEYAFDGIKRVTGAAVEDTLVNTVREIAFEHGLSPARAKALLTKVVAFQDKTASDASVETARLQTAERTALRTQWGNAFDANMDMAKKAVTRFGLTAEVVDAIEKSPGAGYAKTMDFFRDLGSRMGEDRFITAQPGNPGSGVMSAEQAETKYQELRKDPAWVKKWNAGDSEARRQMADLNVIRAQSQKRPT